jgi:type IV pilus assembly protein PilB
MGKALPELLLASGLVKQEAIDKVMANGLPVRSELVGERLVEAGLLKEADLLRLLAREYQTRFVAQEKLETAKIDDLALEKVSVRVAELLMAIPIRLDDATNVLQAVMAEPSEAARQELARAAEVAKVEAFVGTRKAIQAAIRKHYYNEADAFTRARPRGAVRCPQCGAFASVEDFQCPECELLLNVRARPQRSEKDSSVVRALLSSSERGPDDGNPPAGMERTRTGTEVYTLSSTMVPSIVAGLDLMESKLHPFEAYVLSFVDGFYNIGSIASAIGLQEIELKAVISSLQMRGIIELREPPALPKPRPPVEPMTLEVPIQPHPLSLPDSASSIHDVQTTAPKTPRVAADSTDNVLQRAVAMERSGRTEEAIALLEEAIGQLKSPAPVYNRLALIVLDQRRDYDQAEELLRKALALDPKNPVYDMNLRVVLTTKKTREALAADTLTNMPPTTRR